jgi:LPXTG-motif cell wall-anchored protein
MRIHHKPLLLAMSLLLGAGLALGQNAGNKSAGPTQNTFRLRVIEPVEGGTVVGTTVRVTVSNEVPQPTQEARGTNNMPNPSFRVYLGNTIRGEIKRDENVLTIDNVPAGSQRLVIEAMNSSGEIVDRKEINFRTVAAASAMVSSSAQTTELKPMPSAAPASAPKAPAPPAREIVPAPPAAPDVDRTTLPQTASSAPRAALAGAALVLAGLLVSRKRRN